MNPSYFIFAVWLIASFFEGVILSACFLDYDRNRIEPTRIALDLGVAFGSYIRTPLLFLLGFVSIFLAFNYYFIAYTGFGYNVEKATTFPQDMILLLICLVSALLGIGAMYMVSLCEPYGITPGSTNDKLYRRTEVAVGIGIGIDLILVLVYFAI